MGRITAIEAQARDARRYNLYVEDRFAVGLSALVAAKLHVGQVLSDSDLATIKQEEALEDAHDKALRFLEPRPRSRSEVQQHLLKKRVAAEVIDAVLARLTNAGLLDDAAFARYWVENREEFRPRSERALRFELRRKGLDDDAIAEAVSALDEDASAYRAGQARAKRWSHLEYRDFFEKLGGFLVRRGFSYEVAKGAVARLWKEVHE